MKTHGALFNGIGGFQLAADWAGYENTMSCEIDPYCNSKTKNHYPNCIQHGDITTTDFRVYRGKINVLTGGFPCQDISAANFKSTGITGNRSGLWCHYARAIQEISPKYCIIENSPNLLKKGFEKVLSDLSKIGYNAEWECITASAFGYPHERERLFIVAYANGVRQPGQGNIFENISYNEKSRDWEANRIINAIQRKTLPTLCNSNNGFPERVVKNGKITLANCALHALGNAIVPEIAYEIFKAITHE